MKFLKEKRLVYLELAIILFLSFFIIFANLSKGNLADWDEATYGQIAKEISQGQINYFIKLDNLGKPPLYYYLVALSFKIFGITTFAARLWPALFGIGTVIITFFLGKKLFNHRIAFMSSLILLTAPQFLHFSRMLMFDIPMTFFITLSIYLFVLSRENKNFCYLLGISLGLGIMIKGVIGLIPFAVIFSFLLFTRNIKQIKKKEFIILLIISIAISLPWYLTQFFIYKAEFINNYFVEYVINNFKSAQDFYGLSHAYGNLFYFSVLIQGLGLWFIVSIIAVLYFIFFKIEKPFEIDHFSKFSWIKKLLLLWMIINIGIFLIAKTKLPWYIIPLYPSLSIITSYFLDNLNFKKIKVGFVLFLIIFILSFNIPEPFYCNNAAYNINQITQGKLKVHESISLRNGEIFYLGRERYSSEELTKESDFFLVDKNSFNKFKNYKKVYEEDNYFLISDKEISIDKQKISKIPEVQKEPIRYCYAYMPINLGGYKRYIGI